MGFVVNSGGLGSASDDAAQCVALGYASYMFNPSCWGQSYAAWQAQYYGADTLTVVPPAAPGAPSDITTAVPDTSGSTAQDLSNATLGQAQASNAALNPATADACQTLSNSWPYPLGNLTCPTMMLWGVGIFAAFLILPGMIKR